MKFLAQYYDAQIYEVSRQEYLELKDKRNDIFYYISDDDGKIVSGGQVCGRLIGRNLQIFELDERYKYEQEKVVEVNEFAEYSKVVDEFFEKIKAL